MLEIVKASPKESQGITHSSAVWTLKEYPWVFIYKIEGHSWGVCSMSNRLPKQEKRPVWLSRLEGEANPGQVATFLFEGRNFGSREEVVEALTQARAEQMITQASSLGQIL